MALARAMTAAVKAAQACLDERRVPADALYECTDNPTDITSFLFKDLPIWEDENWQFPYYSLNRNGMTCTIYEDRTILIAGEHEDYSDPNFHIYNDVIVVDANKQVRVYSYPNDVFPPTDFHAAIVISGFIWVIGSVGYYYENNSADASIQVCRLEVATMKMEVVETQGDMPPWTNFQNDEKNRCTLSKDGKSIQVICMSIVEDVIWTLDTDTRIWSCVVHTHVIRQREPCVWKHGLLMFSAEQLRFFEACKAKCTDM